MLRSSNVVSHEVLEVHATVESHVVVKVHVTAHATADVMQCHVE